MTKPSEILIAADKWFTGPDRWRQKHTFKPSYADPAGKDGPVPVQACILGGLVIGLHACGAGPVEGDDLRRTMDYLKEAIGSRSVALANDRLTTTFEDVKRWYKRAIELALRDETSADHDPPSGNTL